MCLIFFFLNFTPILLVAQNKNVRQILFVNFNFFEMKKTKIKISTLVVGLFLLSSFSTIQLSKCEIAAIEIHNDLQAAGYSHADAYEISGIALEFCEWAASF